MKTIVKLLQLKLNKKEIVIGKRILGIVMIPIFVLQMCSMNLFLSQVAIAADDEATTQTIVEEPADEPAEEESTINDEEEVSNEEEAPAVTEEDNIPVVEVTSVSEIVEAPAIPDVSTLIEQPIDGAITPEVASIESPAEEIVTLAASAEASIQEPEWELSDDGKTAEISPVEIDKTYKAPQNEDVTVTFTKLPDNPGTLSIEEINLTDEQVEMLGALSNKAYDITSDMENGTFEYDLTLPKPKDQKNVQIKYAEDIAGLENADTVAIGDVKIKTDSVSAKLDHFTLFLITVAVAVANGGTIDGTKIVAGAVNPIVDVSLAGDTFKAAADTVDTGNWTIGLGTTGLASPVVTIKSATTAAVSFTGTTLAGAVSIQANATALALNLDSNIVNVPVATPVFNGDVSGSVSATGLNVSGSTTGAYDTTISGILTEYSNPGQRVSFSGIISGDITGTATGGVNYNGADTLFAEITGSGAVGHVYLIGYFEGADGHFVARFVTQENPINFTTAINITGGTSVTLGSTMPLSATTDGDSQDVVWSVWTNSSDPAHGSATINRTTGLLTATGVGNVTVIASALDGSLVTQNHVVTVSAPAPDTIAPTCSTGVLNGDGILDTVQLVLTCSHAVKFASSGTATADATDLGKIRIAGWHGPHTPNSATISGNDLTLIFNTGDGTFTQDMEIDMGALANSSDILNSAIAISSASITDNAKPKVGVYYMLNPPLFPPYTTPIIMLANQAGGFDIGFSNTEGGALTYNGGCTAFSSMGWGATGGNLTFGGNPNFPDGVYDDCTVTLTDGNGNFGTGNIPTFIVDTTGPVTGPITITPLYNNGGVNYISALSNISAPVTDAGTGVDPTTCHWSYDGGNNSGTSLTTNYDGEKCIFTNADTSYVTAGGINVWAGWDNAGHQGALGTAVLVTVDSAVPTASITFPTEGSTISGTETITANVSDTGSGVAKVEFWYASIGEEIGDGTETSPGVYSIDWDTTSVSDGTHQLWTVAYDNVGNYVSSSQISVDVENDSTAPTTTDDVDGIWRNTDATVNLACIDTESGCAATYYTTDGSDPTTGSAIGNSFTLSAEGKYTIKYFSVDNAGNSEGIVTAANRVKIDKTIPQGSITSPVSGSTIGGTVTINADASDGNISLSGVSKVEFYHSSIAPTPIGEDTAEPYSINWDTAGVSDGAHTIFIKVYDYAGNDTGFNIYIPVIVDNTVPVVTNVNVVEKNTWNDYSLYIKGDSAFRIRADVSDAGSGLNTATCEYSLDNGANWIAGLYNSSTGRCIADISPTIADGTVYMINVRVTDFAGNIGEGTTVSYTVDSATPSTTSITISPDTGTYTNANPTITGTITDSVSPITQCQYRYRTTGSAWPTFTNNGTWDGTNCTATISGLVDGQSYDFSMRGLDSVGHYGGGLQNNITRIIDATAPTVASVSSDGQTYNLATSSPQRITVTFSEDIATAPTIGINPTPIDPQTVDDCSDGDAKTFCFDYTIPTGVEVEHRIWISGATDLVGNILTEDSSHTFIVDTLAPAVTFIDPTPSDGLITNNNDQTFKVNVSEKVNSCTLNFNGNYAERQIANGLSDGSGFTSILSGDDQATMYSLPFNFLFYGNSYNNLSVSTNALLRFNSSADNSLGNSDANLMSRIGIATLWDDLVTSVYAQNNSDNVRFRWTGTGWSTGGTLTNEAVLRSNGQVELHYGDINLPSRDITAGLSAGNGVDYVFSSVNGQSVISPVSYAYSPGATASYPMTLNPDETYSVTLDGMEDGVTNYSVVCTDLAQNGGTSASQSITVDTIAPTVDAGTDKFISSDFSQDATASDSGSGIASYEWTKVSGPGNVTFGTPDAEDTTISVDILNTYVFRLTVTDRAGNSASDTFTNTPLSDIHGYKWSDLNGDGVRNFTDCENRDISGGIFGINTAFAVGMCREYSESLLSGWEIFIDQNGNSVWDNNEPKTTTSSDPDPNHFGWYWFEDLLPGEYRICEVLQEGWRRTSPLDPICYTVTLPDSNPGLFQISANMVVGPEYNFGNQQLGKITVIKTTENNTDKTFPFTSNFANTFILGQNGTWTSEFLVPGEYTVSEETLVSDHWSFDSLNCVDSTQQATFAQNGDKVSIDLAAGSNVTCTYYNTYARGSTGGGGGNGGGTTITTTGGTTGGGTTEGGSVEGVSTEGGQASEENNGGGEVLGEETQNLIEGLQENGKPWWMNWWYWLLALIALLLGGGWLWARRKQD